jgi:hypothetical protein
VKKALDRMPIAGPMVSILKELMDRGSLYHKESPFCDLSDGIKYIQQFKNIAD